MALVCRRCDADAVLGDTRCTIHGGKSDSFTAGRIRRTAQAHVGRGPLDLAVRAGWITVSKEVAEREVPFGAPIQVDPGVALLQEIHRTAGHVAWLERKVRTMKESAIVWGKVAVEEEKKEGGGPTGDYTLVRRQQASTVNVWWQLYQKEREHLARISLAAIKAGIEERRVRLAERSLDALEGAVLQTMSQLGADVSGVDVRMLLSTNLETILFASGNFTDEQLAALPPAAPVAPPLDAEPNRAIINLPQAVEF